MPARIADAFGSNGSTWTTLDDGSSWSHATPNVSGFKSGPTIDNSSGAARVQAQLNAVPASAIPAVMGSTLDSTSNTSTYTYASTSYDSRATYIVCFTTASSAAGTAAPTLSSWGGTVSGATFTLLTSNTVSSSASAADYYCAMYSLKFSANTTGTVIANLTGTSQTTQMAIISIGNSSIRNATTSRCSGGNTAESSPRTTTVTVSGNTSNGRVFSWSFLDKNSANSTVSTNASGGGNTLINQNKGTPSVTNIAGYTVSGISASTTIGIAWSSTTNVWMVLGCELYDPDEGTITAAGSPGLITHTAGSQSDYAVEITMAVNNGYQGPMFRRQSSSTFMYATQLWGSWNGASYSWGIGIFTCINGTITSLGPTGATASGDGPAYTSPYGNIAIRCYDAGGVVRIQAKAWNTGFEPNYEPDFTGTSFLTHTSNAVTLSVTTSSASFLGLSGTSGAVTSMVLGDVFYNSSASALVATIDNFTVPSFTIDNYTQQIMRLNEAGQFNRNQAVTRSTRW